MRFLGIVALFLGIFFGLLMPSQAVIYEFDSRLDIYEIDGASPIMNTSNSVAAVVDASEVRWAITGDFLPDQLKTLQERKRVCPDVRFSEQPTMGFCSSFLVAPDKVVLARHCLGAAPCTMMRFVFDFALDGSHSWEHLSEQNVYRCKSFSYPRDIQGPTYDFAVVELDRPVEGRQPLPLRKALSPSMDARFYAVGHPNGLPQKVTSGGELMADHGSYFLTQLDTFHGNSGSPVLNSATHEVEGVLIDGEMDYENRGSCRIPRVCLGNTCSGETVLDISNVVDFLNQ